ncbi:MAG TPA: archease [Deltaproteobacteria bacterium]|nr:archease [Deltaproteobacteria bacterium]HPP79347.1 archease [Deltaproteobacteria bacterium]
MPYALVDHTADMALRVRAPSIEALFAEAALGLCEVLDARTSYPEETLRVELEGMDMEDLLVRWLQEVLYLVGVKGFRVYTVGRIAVAGTCLAAELEGAFGCGTLALEVKAVTYHGLSIERDGGDVTATVVLDV